MDDKSQAEEAIRNLHHYDLNGQPMNVELSRGKLRGSTKLHVGNLACTNQELRAKFEEFGRVLECDIVKNYAFVHMERLDDAMDAINNLDNAAFKGKLMSVKLSTSRLRTAPGMGDRASCYRCGEEGHWSKECPLDQNGYPRNGSGPRSDGFDAPRFAGRGRNRGYNPGFGGEPEFEGAYPPVPSSRGPPGYRRGAAYESSVRYGPPAYGGGPEQDVARMYSAEAAYRSSSSYYGAVPSYPVRRSAYERDPYEAVDYYERYRAGAYSASYLEDRRSVPIPAPPPPSSAIMRERLQPSAYSIPPIPPPPAPVSSYLTRERSPIRRVPDPIGYSYDRSHVPSTASLQRSSTYEHPRDPAADRARYGY
uniref:RNA-binding protein 4.1-like n=2 Tax=Knipowitschia caucasica TaxID=637954 RepID=A0AAV2KRF5_KNICA